MANPPLPIRAGEFPPFSYSTLNFSPQEITDLGFAPAEAAQDKKKSAEHGATSASTSSTSLRLLDPKAKIPASSTSSSKRGTPSESDGEGPGMATLIEKMHQVEPRVEGFKRRKVLNETGDEGDDHEKRKEFGPMGGDGSLSNFFKNGEDAAPKDGSLDMHDPSPAVEKPASDDVVDLTNGMLSFELPFANPFPFVDILKYILRSLYTILYFRILCSLCQHLRHPIG
jgi:hypothetical protein